MFPYFPFSGDEYKMTMGVQALGDRPLIEIDLDHYAAELALKEELLSSQYSDYFRAAPGSERMQEEVLEMLLPILARDYPQHFSLVRDGDCWHWRNALLNSEHTFRVGGDSDLLLPPLDWLGRQVQEDLLILDGTGDMPLLAGQLCFPNSWNLEDKMGKSFLAIHSEVPLFAERIGRSSNLLLERLKPDRTVWRVNWSIKSSPQLNHLVRSSQQAQHSDSVHTASLLDLTPKNIGERCYLRIERQALSRLPRTNGILFTIHTYQSPLAAITAHAARDMAAVLQTTPATLLDYKGMTPFMDALLAYLAS
jgi:hypothetical protein